MGERRPVPSRTYQKYFGHILYFRDNKSIDCVTRAFSLESNHTRKGIQKLFYIL